MNVHEGHRARIKEQFLRYGLDAMPEHQVLELLLYFANPRGDVNPLAHSLIQTFKSLRGVLDAPYEELLKVPGVGPNTATLLTLMTPLFRRYQLSEGETVRLDSLRAVGKVVVPLFTGRLDEAVYLICLDAKSRVTDIVLISEGSVTSAPVDVRRIAQEALSRSACGAMLAHNHVNGEAKPSMQDLETTRRVAEALHIVGVELVDHIVVADRDFVSLRRDYANRGIFTC